MSRRSVTILSLVGLLCSLGLLAGSCRDASFSKGGFGLAHGCLAHVIVDDKSSSMNWGDPGPIPLPYFRKLPFGHLAILPLWHYE